MAKSNVQQNTGGKARPVLCMGSTGRVARLLQSAWSLLEFNDIHWQSRRPDLITSASVCDPVASSSSFSDLIDHGSIVFALAGIAPHSNGALSDNVSLALSVFEAARASGAAHVFLVSTSAVYGKAAYPIPEDMPPAPESPYGREKLRMETAIRQSVDRTNSNEPKLTILRLGNVLGADALYRDVDIAAETVLDQFADKCGPLRSYIGPVTLARTLISLFNAAGSNKDIPEILNVAAPKPVSMAGLLNAADRAWRYRPAPKGTMQSVVLETSRLSRLHQFSGRESIAENMVAELKSLEKAAK